MTNTEFTEQDLNEEGQERLEFGEFVRNMRNSVEWEEQDMASKLDIHKSTVTRLEKGTKLGVPNDLHLLELKIREVVKKELKNRRLVKQ